jgi:2-octaprenyl-6-methoxyphenol hydroxylase
MKNNQNFDITIIGGSFAGMTAALSLAQISPDLKIAVIEKLDIVKQDRKRDGRAYAISSASLKLFKEIGIYDELLPTAGKISDIKITDYKSPFILDFIGLEVDEKDGQLGQIIENYHIHNALRNRLLVQKNITLFSPNFYEEIEMGDSCFDKLNMTRHPELVEGCLVKLDNKETIASKLILACDGRFSPLRKKYQIPTTEKNYQQTAIVFNISHEASHENVAYEKFLPGGPLAILPLKNSHHSSIVWIAPNQLAQAILKLDEENFTHQLTKKMENCLGKVAIISEKFSYPLIAIEAQKFYHEKMLLIGDASCGVHPIAGQGFNLAVCGINVLRELIEKNLFCGLAIDSQSLIEAYNKKAKRDAKKMLVATDILNSLFETKALSVGLVRDFGLGLVNKLPRLKKFFIKNAGGF